MAQIGALGDIAFEVSSDQVLTIQNLVWSGSAEYQTHKRHLTNALTEFTGVDPDKITFDIVLSQHLGVNPREELGKLWKYERGGIAVPLTIGDHAYGKYRWNVVSHITKFQTFDKDGNEASTKVSVTLQEYLRS